MIAQIKNLILRTQIDGTDSSLNNIVDVCKIALQFPVL